MGKVAGILMGGVDVVSSNPTGGILFLLKCLKPLMFLLFRNVRYVLKTKNLNVASSIFIV